MFLILLFKLLTQFPFVSFLSISILSLLPFSILSLLPLHHPFFLFWSILCPPKIKTSIYYILFTNGTYFCILFHTMTYLFFNNAFYKLEKNQMFMLEFQLVIPWGLEETMAPFLKVLFWSILCPLSAWVLCSTERLVFTAVIKLVNYIHEESIEMYQISLFKVSGFTKPVQMKTYQFNWTKNFYGCLMNILIQNQQQNTSNYWLLQDVAMEAMHLHVQEMLSFLHILRMSWSRHCVPWWRIPYFLCDHEDHTITRNM